MLHRCIARLKCDGTCAETRFSLSAKWTSPFKLGGGGASVQSTTGSWGVCISGSNGSNAGYTMLWGRVQDYWLLTPLACFPFTFPYRASPCAIRFQLSYTSEASKHNNQMSDITVVPEDKLQVEYLCMPVLCPLYSTWNYSIISYYSLSPHFLPQIEHCFYPPSLNLHVVVEFCFFFLVNQHSFNCENVINYKIYVICCT